MTVFQRLLGLDLPAGAELTEVGITLRGGIPGWLVACLAAAALALAFAIYWRERSLTDRGRRLLLAGLRGSALALLVWLMARPAVVAEAHGQRPRDVALLVDNSASLKQADRRLSPADVSRVALAKGLPVFENGAQPHSSGRDEPSQVSRADLVRAVLANSRLDLANRLRQRHPLRAYLFGDKARRVEISALPAALSAGDDRSALADALLEVANDPNSDPPAAIVLVTDGLDNASKTTLDEAAAECAKLGVAVHAYGVGSTDSGAVRLVDAAIPDTIFTDDVASVPIRWRYRGVKRVDALVTLTLGGREVARRQISLLPGEGRETLTFTPPKQSSPAQELTVSVRANDDSAGGDELSRAVTVSERRVRVLVVDDAPRWEFKFLQPALSRDRRVEATYLLAQGDPRALRAEPFLPAFPPRHQLFGFDLVILGDVAADFLGPEGVSALVDFVREGGGLAVIAGRRHMPGSFAESVLADVLPVEFIPARDWAGTSGRTAPFSAQLTPAGGRSEMLQLGETPGVNERLWRELPGFHWHYPVTKLRPGAVTLLAHPTQKLADDTPMPLLAIHNYGKGLVMFLAAEETWRWRYNAGDRVYSRLWGQVAYRLGLPHLLGHGSRVQLTLDGTEAVVGRPGYVYARLLDAEYRPFVTDRVPAILEWMDPAAAERSRSLSLDPVPGRPGEYRAMLPHDAPGRFELNISQPEPGTLGYRVTLPPGHELEPAGLADAPLRQLARTTGGGFYREEDLERLPESIVPQTAPFSVRQEALLWNPLALFAFVAMVSAEWVIRKFANLS